MTNTKDMCSTLTKVFTNRKLMLSLLDDMPQYNPDIIDMKLSNILIYYLLSKDTNTRLTYDEINERCESLLNDYYGNEDALKEKIINELYLTHSFNGYKKKEVSKYGFDYISHLEEDERKKYLEMRSLLNELEEGVEKSFYVSDEENEEEKLFMTSPGVKSIYYANKNAPERLYLGPLRQGTKNVEPIIIGESKESYMFRVLKSKIEKKYSKDSEEYNKYISIARKVVRRYCKLPPSIALVNVKDVIDKPIVPTNISIDETEETFRELFDTVPIFSISTFFSQEPRDFSETNNLGDIAFYKKGFDLENLGIFDIMDSFDIMQLYAQSKGAVLGDKVDYQTLEVISKCNIEELMNVIENLKTIKDLNRVKDIYSVLKLSTLMKSIELSESIGNPDEEELRDKQRLLARAKKDIMESPFRRKKVLEYDSELKTALGTLHYNKLYNNLLEQDEQIVHDNLQYPSVTHGVNHTRRVNFFANMIISQHRSALSSRDKDIVFQIVKNHDIGRENDSEDIEHGQKSVELLMKNPDRLEAYTDEEKDLIMFAIREHVLSNKTNKEHLESIDEGKRKRYELILSIVKDADKLDRVRLDPMGFMSEVGLDPTRLSLQYSSLLEPLAYEAYDKVIEIMNIDKELGRINKLKELSLDLRYSKEFESRIEHKESLLNKKIIMLFNEIIKKGKETTIYSKIRSMQDLFPDRDKELSDSNERGDFDGRGI